MKFYCVTREDDRLVAHEFDTLEEAEAFASTADNFGLYHAFSSADAVEKYSDRYATE